MCRLRPIGGGTRWGTRCGTSMGAWWLSKTGLQAQVTGEVFCCQLMQVHASEAGACSCLYGKASACRAPAFPVGHDRRCHVAMTRVHNSVHMAAGAYPLMVSWCSRMVPLAWPAMLK